MALEQNIQRIEEKLHLLLRKMQQVQGENTQLKTTLQEQQQTIDQYQGTVSALEERLQMMKIASAHHGNAQGNSAKSEDNEAFRRDIRNKINEYIREIDRCIALLNG